MAQRKYVSIPKLSVFLNNLKNLFAPISHRHTLSEISDYKVDSTLSSTSSNPVENKTIKSEFDLITNKIDTNLSTAKTYTDSKSNSVLNDAKDYTNGSVEKKSLVQIIVWGIDD